MLNVNEIMPASLSHEDNLANEYDFFCIVIYIVITRIIETAEWVCLEHAWKCRSWVGFIYILCKLFNLLKNFTVSLLKRKAYGIFDWVKNCDPFVHWCFEVL